MQSITQHSLDIMMTSIEQINQQIAAFEKKATDLKKKRAKEIARIRHQQKKEQRSAIDAWGIAFERKFKNENDQNKRNEIHAYLKSALKEMTSKTQKGEKRISESIKYLDQLLAEASATENQKQADTEPTI